jgi:hypothetical protein
MQRRSIEFEDVLRWFAIAGAVAFVGSIGVALLGYATRTLAPFYGSTLRFLFAVLLLTAPYAELVEIRERRWRRLSLEERLGLASHDASPAH